MRALAINLTATPYTGAQKYKKFYQLTSFGLPHIQTVRV